MTLKELKKSVNLGEDSKNQFKADIHSPEQLAAEMVAFSNADGGTIYVGVTDDGNICALDPANVRRLNQMISNVASTFIHSPIAVDTENVDVGRGVVMVIKVREGVDKPYFDKDGVIWLKVGADKRRVNSKEEIRRFFQETRQLHADEGEVGVGVEGLDRVRFREFLERKMGAEMPLADAEIKILLQGMNLMSGSERLNLAGVLMFAQHPEYVIPQFIVKAVRFPGTAVSSTAYLDSEDIVGPLSAQYDGVMGFLSRNLRKLQPSGGVNYPGEQEVPSDALSEFVVNALVHRDYFVSAPVRVFVFDDRIEIVSPGHLPNHLTVEKILHGNTNIRNPIIASFVARGLLPYHGLGSGIARARVLYPMVDLIDDRDGCQFMVIVRRPTAAVPHVGAESLTTRQLQVLSLIEENERISIRALAVELDINVSAVQAHVAALREKGVLSREGGTRGRWIVHANGISAGDSSATRV